MAKQPRRRSVGEFMKSGDWSDYWTTRISRAEAGRIWVRGYPLEEIVEKLSYVEAMWLLRTPSFHGALVTVGEEQLKIEWAQDSAFRFYPVQEDERFGYRLHDAQDRPLPNEEHPVRIVLLPWEEA